MIKILEFIIYWAVIILPFSMAISNGMMNSFMALLIVAFLLKKIFKREALFAKSGINLPLLCFFVVTLLSIIYSINFKDTLKGGILRLLQYVFVVFAVIDGVKDKRHVWKIIISLAAGVTLISLDSVWQVLTGKDLIRGYAPIINIGLVRATASFSDANVLGIYLSAIAPLFFGLALYYSKIKGKLFFILLSVLGLIGIALTYSRPTLLAAYIAFLFLAVIRKNKKLMAILLIFLVISPFLLPKSVKEWAKIVEYNPVRFMCNDDRIAIYINSVQMIKASPVIGHGANTYMKTYRKYKLNPEYRNIVTPDYIYAHNNIFQMLAEIGFLGFGIFIWLLIAIFRENIFIYKKLNDDFIKVVLLSVTACLVAFLINGLTESSLYYSRVSMIFWYMVGLSLSLKKFSDMKSAS
ncbi:MAG: O-antigen ligase family protein [Candidatus Omnitrophota bacterium]